MGSYVSPYVPPPFAYQTPNRLARSQTDKQSYNPYKRPVRRSLNNDLLAQKPYHETQLSPQKEQDESTDGKFPNSEVSDGLRSSELPDTIRKSGDGESASTLQSHEDGAITCREFETVPPGAENEDEEYHRKMTFKLEPNVFSPKHNIQLPN